MDIYRDIGDQASKGCCNCLVDCGGGGTGVGVNAAEVNEVGADLVLILALKPSGSSMQEGGQSQIPSNSWTSARVERQSLIVFGFTTFSENRKHLK